MSGRSFRETDFGGYLVDQHGESIAYNELTAVLWKVCQELTARVKTLEAIWVALNFPTGVTVLPAPLVRRLRSAHCRWAQPSSIRLHSSLRSLKRHRRSPLSASQARQWHAQRRPGQPNHRSGG